MREVCYCSYCCCCYCAYLRVQFFSLVVVVGDGQDLHVFYVLSECGQLVKAVIVVVVVVVIIVVVVVAVVVVVVVTDKSVDYNHCI